MDFLELKGKPFVIVNEELYNRIKKNYKRVKKIGEKTKTNCFRIYDKDIPSFPFTIDYYDSRLCINYYWTKKSSKEEYLQQKAILSEVLQLLLPIDMSNIIYKNRKSRSEKEQFEKQMSRSENFTVIENGNLFRINLDEYIDTGLFLDHKPARELVSKMCRNKRVLNLFAYTTSFSIYALNNGAKFCRSVDISNTYLKWGEANHLLNSISKSKYELVRDDCIEHLKYAVKKKEKFDFIIMDPPTLSRAKKMKKSFFQIQKDHEELIHNAMKLLSSDGTLLFSNNLTTFKMSKEILNTYFVDDISLKTIPEGFRNKKIHKAFLIKNLE